MKGSLTVEASFIFPFCFVVIVVICLLGIYQYDKAVLKMTGYECILQTMEERNLTDAEFQKQLLKRAEDAGKERIFCVKQLDTKIQITATKIALSYQGTQSMLGIPIEVTVTYQKVHPEMTLWMTRGVTGE